MKLKFRFVSEQERGVMEHECELFTCVSYDDGESGEYMKVFTDDGCVFQWIYDFEVLP